MQELNEEQRALIKEIMERENPQRKVDQVVTKTKTAMQILEKYSKQANVDTIVRKQLKSTNVHNQIVKKDSLFETFKKFLKRCTDSVNKNRDKQIDEYLEKRCKSLAEDGVYSTKIVLGEKDLYIEKEDVERFAIEHDLYCWGPDANNVMILSGISKKMTILI